VEGACVTREDSSEIDELDADNCRNYDDDDDNCRTDNDEVKDCIGITKEKIAKWFENGFSLEELRYLLYNKLYRNSFYYSSFHNNNSKEEIKDHFESIFPLTKEEVTGWFKSPTEGGLDVEKIRRKAIFHRQQRNMSRDNNRTDDIDMLKNASIKQLKAWLLNEATNGLIVIKDDLFTDTVNTKIVHTGDMKVYQVFCIGKLTLCGQLIVQGVNISPPYDMQYDAVKRMVASKYYFTKGLAMGKNKDILTIGSLTLLCIQWLGMQNYIKPLCKTYTCFIFTIDCLILVKDQTIMKLECS